MTTSTANDSRPGQLRALRPADRLASTLARRMPNSHVRSRRGEVPDHWSFWLGYIALFSLAVVLVSGTILTLWFEPSMAHTTYDGYVPLRGVPMSEAYASTLEISFEIRGGLLTRQVHYWGSHVFVAAMTVHLLRVFVAGAFRGPRQLNWLLGLSLLVIGTITAYTGHVLPDDLLSGTGLRVIEGGMVAIPIVGTYLSALIFGGEYPGDDIVGRLYVVHAFVLPALLLALLAAHVVLVRRQGHTHRHGGTNRVVSRATHRARLAGFAVIVTGLVVTMAATLQINPVWLHGPYNPAQADSGSRPDWYFAFLDGALRLMPPWELNVFGYSLTLSVLMPVVILPGLVFLTLAAYPWLERKLLDDDGTRHISDRPRDVPGRAGFGVAFIVFYLLLWIAGANDQVATVFGLSVNSVTWFLRVGVIALPPLAYWLTRQICLGLRQRDLETVAHGRESGIVVASANGGFTELKVPLGPEEVSELVPPAGRLPQQRVPDPDENGIPFPRARLERMRARLARAYLGESVQAGRPRAELPEARHPIDRASGFGARE